MLDHYHNRIHAYEAEIAAHETYHCHLQNCRSLRYFHATVEAAIFATAANAAARSYQLAAPDKSLLRAVTENAAVLRMTNPLPLSMAAICILTGSLFFSDVGAIRKFNNGMKLHSGAIEKGTKELRKAREVASS